MAITGTNFVRGTRHGIQAARKLWPRVRDRFDVRRHSLALRHWDERHKYNPGMLLDQYSYEGIKSLAGLGVYEMRLDDDIGGHENLRVLFFDPPKNWEPLAAEKRPMRIVWVLEAIPKKRDGWTTAQIDRFRASRLLICTRCYGRTS